MSRTDEACACKQVGSVGPGAECCGCLGEGSGVEGSGSGEAGTNGKLLWLRVEEVEFSPGRQSLGELRGSWQFEGALPQEFCYTFSINANARARNEAVLVAESLGLWLVQQSAAVPVQVLSEARHRIAGFYGFKLPITMARRRRRAAALKGWERRRARLA